MPGVATLTSDHDRASVEGVADVASRCVPQDAVSPMTTPMTQTMTHDAVMTHVYQH